MTTFRYDGAMAPSGRRTLTVCRRGHDMSEANSYYFSDGHRTCRICKAMRNANRVRPRQGVQNRAGSDGAWEIELSAAIVHQAMADYRHGDGEDYESALEFLCHCGLIRHDGSIRRPR